MNATLCKVYINVICNNRVFIVQLIKCIKFICNDKKIKIR